jgi:hypothetical protein
MQKIKNKEFFNVWVRRLGAAAGERRPSNVARTKHIPQTLNPTRFKGHFRGRDWSVVQISAWIQNMVIQWLASRIDHPITFLAFQRICRMTARVYVFPPIVNSFATIMGGEVAG